MSDAVLKNRSAAVKFTAKPRERALTCPPVYAIMPHMKGSELKKLNRARTSDGVERNILGAGFVPFAEGDIAGLSQMTVFKSREKHTRRLKKADGLYVKLQSFSSPEGAEEWEFLVLNGDERARGEDGKKFSPRTCLMFCRKIKK